MDTIYYFAYLEYKTCKSYDFYSELVSGWAKKVAQRECDPVGMLKG